MALIPTFQLTPDKVNGTEVYICAGVPCDNTYQDIWTYPAHNGTVADQVQLFLNNYLKQVYNADGSKSAFYYNGDSGHPYLMANHAFGEEQNTLIIPTNASNISNCNYVIFRIISQGVSESASVTYTPNKVYFAFINRIEYISALATKVYYEIDYFQTYYRDIQIKNSFIERATTNEALFTNIQDDYKDISTYQTLFYQEFGVLNTSDTRLCFNVFLSKVDNSRTPAGYDIPMTKWFVSSQTFGDMYSELYIGSFHIDTGGQSEVNLMSELLKLVTDDDIQAIMLSRFPIVQYDDIFNPTSTIVYPNVLTETYTFNFNNLINRNYDKKLYSYPYCKVLIHSANGDTLELRPEDLQTDDGNITVKVNLSIGASPTLVAYVSSKVHNKVKVIEYNDSIMCNWNKDTFQTWWNNNQSSLLTNTALKIVGGGLQLAAGLITASGTKSIPAALGVANAVGGAVTSAGAGAGLIAETIDKQNVANSTAGSIISNTAKMFNFMQAPFAIEIIQADSASCVRMTSYFRMYGYAYNQVQSGTYITNIFGNNGGRGPYLKLNNPIIMPIAVPLNSTTIDPYSYLNGVPTNAMTKIKRIFTDGFRCWDISDPKRIGNYQQ